MSDMSMFDDKSPEDKDQEIVQEGKEQEPEKETEAQQPTIVEIDPVELKSQEIKLAKADRVANEVSFIDPIGFAQMKMVAAEFVKDGAVSPDVKNASQMLMKLHAGNEMGMGVTEALNSLYIVNGKITIYGQAVAGRLRKYGWSVAYEEGSDDGVLDKEWCKAIVYKGGKVKYNEDYQFSGFSKMPDEVYSHTMLFSDAEASDGATGPGWKPGRNRALKLRYGAVAAILKTYLPDLLGGAADMKEVAEDYRTTKEDVALRITAATKKKAPEFTAKPVEMAK